MTSSRSCCILTISSSVAQGRRLVERIVNVSSRSPTDPALSPAEDALEFPWTISNKYYTAPVHFSFIETIRTMGDDATEIPACIFVFSITESFKEEFNSMMMRLGHSDFEVSIAVSVPDPRAEQPTENEESAFEGYFSEHGFEYVNGHSGDDFTREHDIDHMEGIPGIGRIIDALSTIIWPSMEQKTGSRRTKARSVVSVPGPPEEEDGLRSLLNADAPGDTSRQHEMAALEKWLTEGADDDKDPWEGQSLTSRPVQNLQAEVSRPTTSGFDDDFSDFISAPPQDNREKTDSDDDSVLPSQAEIQATSRRIFNMGSTSDDELNERDSQTPFDLTRVLGALEAMKEEIAGITDEDERRKAAAKVALGLVYGLEGG